LAEKVQAAQASGKSGPRDGVSGVSWWGKKLHRETL